MCINYMNVVERCAHRQSSNAMSHTLCITVGSRDASQDEITSHSTLIFILKIFEVDFLRTGMLVKLHRVCGAVITSHPHVFLGLINARCLMSLISCALHCQRVNDDSMHVCLFLIDFSAPGLSKNLHGKHHFWQAFPFGSYMIIF